MSQPFGYDPDYPKNGGMHYGTDYRTPVGTAGGSRWGGHVRVSADNYPPTDSSVSIDGMWITKGAWGSYIEVERPDGVRFGYAHLSERWVRVGDEVRAGDVSYATGNTGTATTGPHLHEHKIVAGADGSLWRVDPEEEAEGPQR